MTTRVVSSAGKSAAGSAIALSPTGGAAGSEVGVGPDATLIGRVILEENTSVWFNAVIRGDNEPITVGSVTISPGDLIVGDGDGVVAIPADQVEAVLEKSRERLDQEAAVMERLRRGETTLDIYGW